MRRLTKLQWARFYAKHGWSIIPLQPGTKKPSLKSWKQYQTTPASDEQLVKWFSRGKYDIGVILGSVSGNLACRDFDKAEAFEQWKAEHPDLASRLPIVKSGRGYHVYYCFSQTFRTKKFEDGELRCGGSCMVLPPSTHPSGAQYGWLTDPDSLAS